MRYVYSVVRFVPDPARGEFVNLGAIVGSEESSEWELRQVENPVRARAMDERGTLKAVWTFLDDVGRQFDNHQEGKGTLFGPDVELSESWLQRLYVDHRNMVQLSAPAPIIASDAEEALDKVFDQLVVDPAQRRYRFQKKHIAQAAVRNSYRQQLLAVGKDVRERVELHTTAHRDRLDFAVANGQVVQLAQTWSFQVPDQEMLSEQIKAWGWTMLDLKKGGGVASTHEGTLDVPSDVDIEVVYVSPQPEQNAPALAAAISVFDALEIRHGSLEHASAVGIRARELLVAAGARLDLRPPQRD